ncbi:MAG: TRAP transporter small permease subunit [Spirochaetia bacterium]|jgi:TRAP-type C4-dicarboxylate transport system permease small subunit|nr:TRAP transporter small permease subunit [Spirochaetales bacterium]MDX9783600.1 TRAP transporter small permease subunit [Spirochaetia bacterium]
MRKIYQWFCKVEEIVCGLGFGFLIFFIFISAVLRLFKLSMSWYIDLAMLCLAWTAFLGADIAWRHGQIIGVDIVTRRLPEKIRWTVELVVLVIIAATLVVMVIFGARLAWTERVSRYQSMPIPLALVTLSLVVASFSMVFSTIQKIRRLVLQMRGRTEADPIKGGSR